MSKPRVSSQELRPGPILVVDDDEIFCGRLAQALRERGFSPVVALGVQVASEAISQQHFSFAVIDWRLGDGSGLEVVSLLHALQPQVRQVVISGYANLPGAVSAIREGATDCLPKPLDFEDLTATLLAPDGETQAPPPASLPPEQVRIAHVMRVLEENDGNISLTARRLSMHRRTLQRILVRARDKQNAPKG